MAGAMSERALGDERARIERLIQRDGEAQARVWAHRTEALYRSAVLDHNHFAHTPEYRRRFIQSYLQLKRFALRGALNGPR
jgi:hypothetical protein